MTIDMQPPVVKPATAAGSVIKPRVLSHGTAESRDLVRTREFYEKFLGLSCVQISAGAIAASAGVKFHIVCLQTGDRLRKHLTLLNHWGLEVGSPEEVHEAHRKAHELKGVYGIEAIMPIENVGGRMSFYLEDFDHNWWEIQYYNGCMHDDFYDFGDVTE